MPTVTSSKTMLVLKLNMKMIIVNNNTNMLKMHVQLNGIQEIPIIQTMTAPTAATALPTAQVIWDNQKLNKDMVPMKIPIKVAETTICGRSSRWASLDMASFFPLFYQSNGEFTCASHHFFVPYKHGFAVIISVRHQVL
jgi:hypothetical protein